MSDKITPEQLREWADVYERGEVQPGVVKPNRAEMYRLYAAALEELAALREQLEAAWREVDGWKSLTDLHDEQVEQLEAQLAEKDAELAAAKAAARLIKDDGDAELAALKGHADLMAYGKGTAAINAMVAYRAAYPKEIDA